MACMKGGHGQSVRWLLRRRNHVKARILSWPESSSVLTCHAIVASAWFASPAGHDRVDNVKIRRDRSDVRCCSSSNRLSMSPSCRSAVSSCFPSFNHAWDPSSKSDIADSAAARSFFARFARVCTCRSVVTNQNQRSTAAMPDHSGKQHQLARANLG